MMDENACGLSNVTRGKETVKVEQNANKRRRERN
jgi:hypothetical protein